MVASSSLLTAGFPQEEQKRTFAASSEPQEGQWEFIARTG